MTTMTRFGLAVPFAIGVALFASSPARAQTTLTNTGVEPGASGTATLTDVWYMWTWYGASGTSAWDIYGGDLILRCEGLTPGAQYRVGPTGLDATKNWGLRDTYSYFRAADDGSLNVAVPVEFVRVIWYWNGLDWVAEVVPYQISVARKFKGKNYTPVLVGSVPW